MCLNTEQVYASDCVSKSNGKCPRNCIWSPVYVSLGMSLSPCAESMYLYMCPCLCEPEALHVCMNSDVWDTFLSAWGHMSAWIQVSEPCFKVSEFVCLRQNVCMHSGVWVFEATCLHESRCLSHVSECLSLCVWGRISAIRCLSLHVFSHISYATSCWSHASMFLNPRFRSMIQSSCSEFVDVGVGDMSEK